MHCIKIVRDKLNFTSRTQLIFILQKETTTERKRDKQYNAYDELIMLIKMWGKNTQT